MKLLPRSLFGRLVLVFLLGLVVAQLLSTLVLLRDRGQVLYESFRTNLIHRTVGIVRMVDSLSGPERRRLLEILHSPDLHVQLLPNPLEIPAERQTSQMIAERVHRLLANRLPEDARIRVAIVGSGNEPVPADPVAPPEIRKYHPRHLAGGGRWWAYVQGVEAMGNRFHIQVQLRDGTWLLIERGVSEDILEQPIRLLAVLGILLLSVVTLSLIGVRQIVRPLKELKQAADGLGKDIDRPPLEERGPIEVMRTARAFNTMQQRIKSYIDGRSRLLTAISHDLKTPLTRMRLRAEFMEDGPAKDKLLSDLDDMESMVSATLDFMRGVENAETYQPVDLMALLESIVADAQDSGSVVSLSGTCRTPYQARPLSLKRCINNLVENAVRYGGMAAIRIEESAREVLIAVCDEGPGIPESELERVFDPFYRLESSRARDTGGTGLGLGIASNIARAHGGAIHLENRVGGGLCALLSLPR